MEDRDVRMVLKPAGFIQGECPLWLCPRASLFDRQRPSQSPFGQRLVAALCVKGTEAPSVTATAVERFAMAADRATPPVENWATVSFI